MTTTCLGYELSASKVGPLDFFSIIGILNLVINYLRMTEGSRSNRLKMLIRFYWLYQATMSNAEIMKACPSPTQNLCILHLPFQFQARQTKKIKIKIKKLWILFVCLPEIGTVKLYKVRVCLFGSEIKQMKNFEEKMRRNFFECVWLNGEKGK